MNRLSKSNRVKYVLSSSLLRSKLKFFLFISCISGFVTVSGQGFGNLSKTVWQEKEEGHIYLLYFQGRKYEITDYSKSSYPDGRITISEKRYGFFDSCELPSLESLKQNGAYYFELDSSDFADETFESVNIQNACGEVSFVHTGERNLMTIYFNSRQQFVAYAQVYTLPRNIRKILRKTRIKMRFKSKRM
jgi:hypothetical protein